jgi:predicted hotdog family 3-hydroxylacyl-ACP dehydratase
VEGSFPPIEQLLPHQPPMRLIDRVIAADETGLWASVSICPDSPFLRQGGARALFALEYLAQASAAWFAWRAICVQSAARTQSGMLIACARLEATQPLFHEGQRLLLKVEPRSALPERGGGMVKFAGRVYVTWAEVGSALPDAQATPVVAADFSVYL